MERQSTTLYIVIKFGQVTSSSNMSRQWKGFSNSRGHCKNQKVPAFDRKCWLDCAFQKKKKTFKWTGEQTGEGKREASDGKEGGQAREREAGRWVM